MPKNKSTTPAIVTRDVDEEKTVKLLAEVIWHSGAYDTPHCQKAVLEAGLDPEAITPAMVHKAVEMNDERMRENFRNVNSDPTQRIKVAIQGDKEFDPDLNPDHPVRGRAAIERDAERRARGEAISELEDENAPIDENLYIPDSRSSGVSRPKTRSRERTNDTKGKRRRGGRYTLLGYPATSVIRWMGLNGWTVAEALKAVTTLGLPVAISEDNVEAVNMAVPMGLPVSEPGAPGEGMSYYTVRGQIWFGGHGQGGDPAPLTTEQIRQLNKIVGK